MKRIFSFMIASLLLAATVAIAQSTPALSLATLNGKYAFGGYGDRFGSILFLLPTDTPIADIGYLIFDGKGNVTTGKMFEDVNTTSSTLTETGTYTLNTDNSFTVTLSGTQSRKFNVIADMIDPNTGIAQSANGDDVGFGDGAGDNLSVQFWETFDPQGGWVQSDLAGTYSGEVFGTNAAGQKVSGAMRYVIDESGSITGTGHESDQGVNRADTVSGSVTMSTDGTYSGDIIVNGQSMSLKGIAIAVGDSCPACGHSTLDISNGLFEYFAQQ